jgi:hypothetical protein
MPFRKAAIRTVFENVSVYPFRTENENEYSLKGSSLALLARPNLMNPAELFQLILPISPSTD